MIERPDARADAMAPGLEPGGLSVSAARRLYETISSTTQP
jgi:hypothetical protein